MALTELTSKDLLKTWREKINEIILEIKNYAIKNHASTNTTYGLGDENHYGHLKLSDSLNSVSDKTSGIAATPYAVSEVYKIANSAIKVGEKITGTLEVTTIKGDLEGNAETATLSTNAISDEFGNNINQTYATKNELNQYLNGEISYTNSIKREGTSIQWKEILTDKNSSFLYQKSYAGYMPALNLQTKDGRVGFGTYNNLCRWDYFLSSNETNTPHSYIDLLSNGISITTGNTTINSDFNVVGNVTFNKSLNVTENITSEGTITGSKVYNAVWNDYAEFFPKGEETEVGDIIALDEESQEEQYIKATNQSKLIVGVHSDTYGHIIGGEGSIEDSMKTHIPVGLTGRVYAKIVGKISKGDKVVLSDIPGVGRKFDEKKDSLIDIIGGAVESSEKTEIKLIKIKLR